MDSSTMPAQPAGRSAQTDTGEAFQQRAGPTSRQGGSRSSMPEREGAPWQSGQLTSVVRGALVIAQSQICFSFQLRDHH